MDTPSISVRLQCGERQSSQFAWAQNSLGQDPCTIASYLVQNPQCTGVVKNDTQRIDDLKFIVTSVPPEDSAPRQNDPCYCSSTVYSLASVCRLCQDIEPQLKIPIWEGWARNCGNATGGPDMYNYSLTIPDGTAVPAWAYQSFNSDNGAFNYTIAEVIADNDPSEVAAPSSSITIPATSSTDIMQQPTENASGVSSAVSKSKSLVGPIVGGVVGGVMFLVIAIALIVFLIRREKRKVAPSAAYMRAHGGKLPTYRESMHGAVFPLGREKGIDMTENNSYTSDRPIRQESNSSEQSFDPYQDTRNASHLRSPSNGGRQSYTGVPQEPGTPHSYTEISVTNR